MVVGCYSSLSASLPIAVAVVRNWQVSAALLAVIPARSHGMLWRALGSDGSCTRLLVGSVCGVLSESPLNLALRSSKATR